MSQAGVALVHAMGSRAIRSNHPEERDRTRELTRRSSGAVPSEISESTVVLLKEYYGVGPTQAKTYYQDDLVVCVLRDGFTRVEQTLLAGDRGRAVIEQRVAFQEVMRQRFEAVIQHATGARGDGVHE